MKLIEFVSAYKQLSIKLGKASIFAAYKKQRSLNQRLGRFVCLSLPCLVVSFYMSADCFFSICNWDEMGNMLLVSPYSNKKI